MKILIVGAKGNLGEEFARLYAEHNPLLWDREELDITDRIAVTNMLSQHQPELVINCAAYNNVDQAETEAELAMAINGRGVGNLARACKNIDALLIHYSTHYVFDGRREAGYNEDAVPNGQSVYARSKIRGEQELQSNTEKYYLIRTAWLYSHNRSGGKKSFIDLMLDLARKQSEISVVNNEFGHPTYVKDLAEATDRLVQEQKPFGIYHLTNSGLASWYDWAKQIFSITKQAIKIIPVPANQFPRTVARPQFGIINNTKLAPLCPWQEALEEFLTKQL